MKFKDVWSSAASLLLLSTCTITGAFDESQLEIPDSLNDDELQLGAGQKTRELSDWHL